MSKALYKEGDVVMIINAPKKVENYNYTIFTITEVEEKEEGVIYKLPWMGKDSEGVYGEMYINENFIDLYMSKCSLEEYEDPIDLVDILMLDDGFVFDETMKVWEPS